MLHLELRRQLFHLTLGIVIVFLLWLHLLNAPLLAMLAVMGAFLSYCSKYQNLPIIKEFLDRFERPEERKRFPGKGALYYVLGCLLTVVIFDTLLHQQQIALAAIMILALGDSVSHIIGKTYGKIKHPWNQKKVIEGTIAGIVAGALGAWLFVPLGIAMLGSAVAMIIEAVEIKYKRWIIDDNLLVPLVAGSVIWLVTLIGLR
ncbi:hypothetical protein HZB02_05035 [Candidatus Woesearchaeota archaeon]|nr:hypothetical protein [Candidatus Woesearchaeota archaeon]